MATFNKGDWVQITPQPDRRWSGWTDTHDNFCGKVGQIRDIFEDTENGDTLYNVTTNFPFGFLGQKAGHYYTDFHGDHLIHSTKYDSELSEHFEKVGRELQEWEEFKRRSVDDMLREVFAPPKKQSKMDEIKRVEAGKSDIPANIDFGEDPWEVDTEEVVPLPGSATVFDDDDIDYLLQQYGSDPDVLNMFDKDDD
jgi:hypothetical protein